MKIREAVGFGSSRIQLDKLKSGGLRVRITVTETKAHPRESFARRQFIARRQFGSYRAACGKSDPYFLGRFLSHLLQSV